MRFLSTRTPAALVAAGKDETFVSLRAALVAGLAPDGGLYMPERIERWEADEITRIASLSPVELAARVLRPFTRAEIPDEKLSQLVANALDFPVPLVEVEPGVFSLELFHGPTLAFKDVGARVMARLMALLHDGGDPLTVLVATSGDTGSAVASAFHGVPHMRVAILYPFGRVSPTQEAQLAMYNDDAGANVRAYAVRGSFDDCQRLVKEAFSDAELSASVRLTSANSINIGRLLPQMIYYFSAVAELQRRSSIAGRALIVVTPSGNFGNLTAGLMARKAGLPVTRFVAATNVNDVVPIYLESGRFEPRPSIATLANAMDVGNPSNFERMLWLYGGASRPERGPAALEAMRQDLTGSRHDDAEVRKTIGDVYERVGYVLDPHGAIAYRAAVEQDPEATRVFLATAHPAKFAEIVEPVIGTTVPKPRSLMEALERRLSRTVVEATSGAVREALTAAG
jgi:threonine synthase